MASRIKKMARAFGWPTALALYVRVKWKPHGKFTVAKYGAPFFLRKGTSDYYTFDQVFLRDQYGIDFPFTPQTIVDAGANIGLASVYFAHRYPKAKIVAIEPSRENFQMVLKNIAAYPQVKANCMGLWNKDVYLAITNTEGVKNAFMVAETDADHPDAIPAVSLETIMRGEGWDQIDLLKIDIEGAEKEVFSSGTDYWLPRTKAIVIELHDNMKKGCSQAVFKAISQYPFSCSLQDENLIFIRE